MLIHTMNINTWYIDDTRSAIISTINAEHNTNRNNHNKYSHMTNISDDQQTNTTTHTNRPRDIIVNRNHNAIHTTKMKTSIMQQDAY